MATGMLLVAGGSRIGIGIPLAQFGRRVSVFVKQMNIANLQLKDRSAHAVRGAVLGSVSQKVVHYAEQMVLNVK